MNRWKCRKCGNTDRYKSGECKHCTLERMHKYRKDNIELVRKQERIRARRRSPETQKRMRLNRLKHLLAGDVTREQLIELFEAHNESCRYCGKRIKRPKFNPKDPKGFDHKIPFISGGKHTISNIVPCCYSCNTRKNATGYEAFIERIKRII